ncbi:MAG: HD domain-containing protein [Holosporales bacterium]|jgi:HD superfamily phosphohydrolase|nr:HD domain-containing protein [Holosporales bacterium]
MTKLILKKRVLFALLVSGFACLIIWFHFRCVDHARDTPWLEIDRINDPLIKEFIESPCIQRLKEIDQSGPARYFGQKVAAFSRYEHSIGVLILLRKAGVHINEQIAGLLHDASHTAFSHTADFLFASYLKESAHKGFQDSIHLSFLKRNTPNLLEKYHLTLEDVDPDNGKYLALEQSLPDMCADRIQYNIHTGIIMKMIKTKEAREIVGNLRFNGSKWFFLTAEIAKKFAELSVHFTREFWGAKWNVLMNVYFSNALKRAIKIGLMTMNDVFSTDAKVLNKLLKSEDEIIQTNLKLCNDPSTKVKGKRYTAQKYYPKCRGIDPLVQTADGSLVRLSSIDASFKKKYEDLKEWCQRGYTMEILMLDKD